MQCKCGMFQKFPVIDCVNRIWHTLEECMPWPDWTQRYDDEGVLKRGPWSYGINRMNYFNEGEKHPADCECGDPRAKKHGYVCFRPNRMTYVHTEGMKKFDWERVRTINERAILRPTRSHKG